MRITNLFIPAPCPMSLASMTPNKDCFYCKSCSKNVVDYREKSDLEIMSSIDQNTCGIFYEDQLRGQKTKPFYYSILFYILSFLSIIGFTVKPMSAFANPIDGKSKKVTSTWNLKSDSTQVVKVELKKEKKKKKKIVIFRNKKKYRMGRMPSGNWF
jgi:hypothetical protein